MWKPVAGDTVDKLNLTAGEVREVLSVCDAGRFGTSEISLEDRKNLVDRTESLIKRLERLL